MIAETAFKSRGQGKQDISTFLVKRSRIALDLGQYDRAAADAGRAVILLIAATSPGTSTSYLGEAYFALGRSLLAQGKRDEALPALQSAVQHLQGAIGSDHALTRSAVQLRESVESSQ